MGGEVGFTRLRKQRVVHMAPCDSQYVLRVRRVTHGSAFRRERRVISDRSVRAFEEGACALPGRTHDAPQTSSGIPGQL